MRVLLILPSVLAVACYGNLTPPSPVDVDRGGSSDAGTTGGGSDVGGADTTPTRDTGSPLTCVPDLDGVVRADELQAAVGIPVTYRFSGDGDLPAIDVAGATDADGTHWDWSADTADESVRVTAQPLEGRWYEDSFPEGQFLVDFDRTSGLEAVYAHTGDALMLLGLASAEEAPANGRTLVVYDPPIALYRFPLVPGDEWVSTGEIRNGMVNGLPYAGRDIYETRVEAVGELRLPDLSFDQVTAVNTRVTVQPAVGVSATTRQQSMIAECFGEVARVVADDDAFTQIAELRRLGL